MSNAWGGKPDSLFQLKYQMLFTEDINILFRIGFFNFLLLLI
jgi:hypothetical protein